MLAHLFHLRAQADGEPERFGREHVEPWAEREGWYRHVATLGVEQQDDIEDTLQAVWSRTQHAQRDWTGHEGVRWVEGPEQRSTYIGDVIVLESRQGRAVYEVAFEGFRRIDLPAAEIAPKSPLSP